MVAVTSISISPGLSVTRVEPSDHSTSAGRLSSSTTPNAAGVVGHPPAEPVTCANSVLDSESASSTGVTSTTAAALRRPAGMVTDSTVGVP